MIPLITKMLGNIYCSALPNLLRRYYHHYYASDYADSETETTMWIIFSVLVIIGAIVNAIVSEVGFNRWRTEVTLGKETKPLPKPAKVISNKNESVFEIDKPTYHTVDYCHWFIQNNTNAILGWMNMFTPDFRSKEFVMFAKDVFAKFVKVRDAELMGGRVSYDVKATFLPDEIEGFGNCFMHNYILSNGYENIKLCMSVPDKDGLAAPGDGLLRFFVTFSKKNPLVGVVDGQFLNIECPNCGGSIDMKENSTNVCPFCGATVTFAESDWIMTSIEYVTGETYICNNAVIKSY